MGKTLDELITEEEHIVKKPLRIYKEPLFFGLGAGLANQFSDNITNFLFERGIITNDIILNYEFFLLQENRTENSLLIGYVTYLLTGCVKDIISIITKKGEGDLVERALSYPRLIGLLSGFGTSLIIPGLEMKLGIDYLTYSLSQIPELSLVGEGLVRISNSARKLKTKKRNLIEKIWNFPFENPLLVGLATGSSFIYLFGEDLPFELKLSNKTEIYFAYLKLGLIPCLISSLGAVCLGSLIHSEALRNIKNYFLRGFYAATKSLEDLIKLQEDIAEESRETNREVDELIRLGYLYLKKNYRKNREGDRVRGFEILAEAVRIKNKGADYSNIILNKFERFKKFLKKIAFRRYYLDEIIYRFIYGSYGDRLKALYHLENQLDRDINLDILYAYLLSEEEKRTPELKEECKKQWEKVVESVLNVENFVFIPGGTHEVLGLDRKKLMDNIIIKRSDDVKLIREFNIGNYLHEILGDSVPKPVYMLKLNDEEITQFKRRYYYVMTRILGGPIEKLNIKTIRRIANLFFEFHQRATYYSDELRRNEINIIEIDYNEEFERRFATRAREVLSNDDVMAMRENYRAIAKYFDSQEKCVCHGDAHKGNIITDGRRICIIDPKLTYDLPESDLAFFVDSLNCEDEIVKAYYKRAGGKYKQFYLNFLLSMIRSRFIVSGVSYKYFGGDIREKLGKLSDYIDWAIKFNENENLYYALVQMKKSIEKIRKTP